MVSAKQRAARALFAKRAKSGFFHRKAKHKSRAPIRHSMARRSRTRTIVRYARRGARRARGFMGGGGLKSWFRTGAAGVGGGTIGQTVEGMLGNPTNGMIGKYGGAYLAGGIKGVIAMLIVDTLTGQGNILGNLFGGGRSSGGDTL